MDPKEWVSTETCVSLSSGILAYPRLAGFVRASAGRRAHSDPLRSKLTPYLASRSAWCHTQIQFIVITFSHEVPSSQVTFCEMGPGQDHSLSDFLARGPGSMSSPHSTPNTCPVNLSFLP